MVSEDVRERMRRSGCRHAPGYTFCPESGLRLWCIWCKPHDSPHRENHSAHVLSGTAMGQENGKLIDW